MSHDLDRPVWNALATVHSGLPEGDGRARRFVPSVAPFAATVDYAPESLASLMRLARGGGPMIVIQADPIRLPSALAAAPAAEAVQMISQAPAAAATEAGIDPLGDADAAEMLRLARFANPGPLALRALELGSLWGIRQQGRLVAMAGERLRQPGFTEVSSVCTHPDARGQGLARLLSLHVEARIRQRGDVPYLHAYATNTAAIRLYESIGFRVRSAMHVATVDPSAT